MKRLIIDRRSDWFVVLRPFPSIWISSFVSLFVCLCLFLFISRLFRRQRQRRWTQIFFVVLNLIYLIELIFFLINIRRVEVSVHQSWKEIINRTSLRSFGAELNRIEEVFAGNEDVRLSSWRLISSFREFFFVCRSEIVVVGRLFFSLFFVGSSSAIEDIDRSLLEFDSFVLDRSSNVSNLRCLSRQTPLSWWFDFFVDSLVVERSSFWKILSMSSLKRNSSTNRRFNSLWISLQEPLHRCSSSFSPSLAIPLPLPTVKISPPSSSSRRSRSS